MLQVKQLECCHHYFLDSHFFLIVLKHSSLKQRTQKCGIIRSEVSSEKPHCMLMTEQNKTDKWFLSFALKWVWILQTLSRTLGSSLRFSEVSMRAHYKVVPFEGQVRFSVCDSNLIHDWLKMKKIYLQVGGRHTEWEESEPSMDFGSLKVYPNWHSSSN